MAHGRFKSSPLWAFAAVGKKKGADVREEAVHAIRCGKRDERVRVGGV
jgi:hypothetical protein